MKFRLHRTGLPLHSNRRNLRGVSLHCRHALRRSGRTHGRVQDNGQAMMSAVAQQPASIAIEGDQSSVQFYWSGVLTALYGTKLDHGVQAVGYGTDAGTDYWKFLERVQEVGVFEIPGFTTDMVCDGFDCYLSWYDTATADCKLGYVRGAWHSKIRMIILLDWSDALNFKGMVKPSAVPTTETGKAKARVRASLSALDGFLQAEREASVKGHGQDRVTEPFAFTDGKETGYCYYGFQDMIARVADPAIADYTVKCVCRSCRDVGWRMLS